MKLTVEEIYDRLVNDDKILTKKGRITFTLGDIDIIVRQRDVVGNIMQEWVEGWLKKNDIEFEFGFTVKEKKENALTKLTSKVKNIFSKQKKATVSEQESSRRLVE